MKVGFSYGALSEPLEEQAQAQGCTLSKDAERLEKCREAIMMLNFGLDLPDSMVDKLIERLHKQVMKDVKVVKEGKQNDPN